MLAPFAEGGRQSFLPDSQDARQLNLFTTRTMLAQHSTGGRAVLGALVIASALDHARHNQIELTPLLFGSSQEPEEREDMPDVEDEDDDLTVDDLDEEELDELDEDEDLDEDEE